MLKKVAVDLDGTMSFSSKKFRKLKRWMFGILLPLSLIAPPNRKMLNILRFLEKKGCRITILTARPKSLFRYLSNLWLNYYKVPFEELICVGFIKNIEKNKLKILLEKKIDVFIDNDQKIIKYLDFYEIKSILAWHFQEKF